MNRLHSLWMGEPYPSGGTPGPRPTSYAQAASAAADGLRPGQKIHFFLQDPRQWPNPPLWSFTRELGSNFITLLVSFPFPTTQFALSGPQYPHPIGANLDTEIDALLIPTDLSPSILCIETSKGGVILPLDN